MVCSLSIRHFEGSLADELLLPPSKQVRFYWLGQAGFVIEHDGRRILIDPYLSDALTEKYRGGKYDYTRGYPAPIAPEDFAAVDLVICTHHHTDHMDAATLRPLAEKFPALRFVVPRASIATALCKIGVNPEHIMAMDAGETLTPWAGFALHAIRAAHEKLETDAEGRFRFLGYVMELGTVRILHSGDTIPFDGQIEEVQKLKPAVALLPVNGRSAELLASSIPGNFTLAEAIAFSKHCGIQYTIAHHYGLFAFNTVDRAVIDQACHHSKGALLRADFQLAFECETMRP